MARINNFTAFDWDKGNLEKSRRKHAVSPGECEEVFFNEPVFVFYDEKHSRAEARYYTLGMTDNGRLLFVVFTVRNRLIRVISARPMSKKERKIYHEKAKKYTQL
jgi:uncharacterized DUF497 family protein